MRMCAVPGRSRVTAKKIPEKYTPDAEDQTVNETINCKGPEDGRKKRRGDTCRVVCASLFFASGKVRLS